jgi:hypothetical protein
MKCIKCHQQCIDGYINIDISPIILVRLCPYNDCSGSVPAVAIFVKLCKECRCIYNTRDIQMEYMMEYYEKHKSPLITYQTPVSNEEVVHYLFE